MALFDKTLGGSASVLATLSTGLAVPLHSPSAGLHPAVLGALVGSQLPLVP